MNSLTKIEKADSTHNNISNNSEYTLHTEENKIKYPHRIEELNINESYSPSPYKFKINKRLPEYKLEIFEDYKIKNFKDSSGYFKYFIYIYESKTNKLIQKIKVPDDFVVNYVEIADYNFDGFIDICLTHSFGFLDNCDCIVLLFNKSIKKFIIAHEFDNIPNIKILKKQKIIISTSRSAGGLEFTQNVYKFINNKLTLVEIESQSTCDNLNDKLHYIFKKRMNNGKMKIIKNEYLTEEKRKYERY